jgi:hypothetical protein
MPRDDETEFSKRLARGSEAIKKAAGNKTCGGCTSAILGEGGLGFCSTNENYEGDNLRIYRNTAYACARFNARP